MGCVLSVVFGVLEGGVCFGDRDFQTASSLSLASPMRGSQSKGRAARLAEQTRLAPNTETFSAVHNISVGWLSHPARSPGGLGGRSRIEPRIST